MELLEQVHGDESQQAVLGCSDSVSLVVFGDGVVLLLMGPMAGIHCSLLGTDSVRRAAGTQRTLGGLAIGSRVPASP